MINGQLENQAFSYGQFVWWFGVVEDRHDPLMLGRVRVRIAGYHTAELSQIPSEGLFWAYPIQPITSAAMNGIGASPTGIVEGTWVVGFFRDGHNAQDPIIFGTMGGIPDKSPNAFKGFSDPNAVYPKSDFIGEPDTNRLARNEKISETSIQKQRDAEDKGVSKSLGDGTWDEKTTEYAAKYPYNHVKETESGHVEEWDDTEGAERYRRYHPSGNMIEEHPDGSRVQKVTKDNYEIILGDDYVHIKGSCSITIDGDCNLLVNGNVRQETKGNYDHYVHGNYQLKVGGNSTTENGGMTYIDGSMVDINLPGPGAKF